MSTETCLQESPEKKAAWLVDAKERFPMGTSVRVKESDVPEYVGRLGTVQGYDLGYTGDWPLVYVEMPATRTGDFFYDDELECV